MNLPSSVSNHRQKYLPAFARSSGLPAWRRRFVRDWLLHPIGLRFLVKLHATGHENIPATGPTIILINHIAGLDAVLAGVALQKRSVTPLGKREVLHYPVLSWLIRMWGFIPVDRQQADRQALNRALAMLDAGHCLLVAPEGTRHPHMQTLKDGIAYMATKTNAVIVPTGVEGLDMFTHNIKRLKRTSATVTYGRPFRFKTTGSVRLDRATMRQMTDEAGYQIAKLLSPERRGIYHDIEHATTDTLEFQDLAKFSTSQFHEHSE